MATYTIGVDAGIVVVVTAEDATEEQALQALAEGRHECADPVVVLDARGHLVMECDCCGSALGRDRTGEGLYLCDRCS